MFLEYSLTTEEVMGATVSLRAMPWSIANRRMLAGTSTVVTVSPERIHKTRHILQHDVCRSVANLVHVPSPGRAETVLISPRHSTIDVHGNRVLANPTVYIIDAERGVCHLRTGALCSKECLQQVDLAFLRDALADRASFLPIEDADRRALRAGEFPQINVRTRLALWNHESRRQRASADRGLDLRIVAESARYFYEVTWMVVEPLIEEVRRVERQLIMSFLRPLLEIRRKRPVTPRFTAAERDQHRAQAIATYPFLMGLWHRDSKSEAPDANSVTGRLQTVDKQLLRRAIDDGQPLTELLVQLLDLEPWMLNHLRGHWATFRAYDRSTAPDRQWEVGRTLALFTPETAPKTIEELLHLRNLTERMDRTPTPIVHCLGVTITPLDRRQLKTVLGSTTKTALLLEYLDFIYLVNSWIAKHVGQNHYAELPELLGVRRFDDWWTLARRWQSRNKKLARQILTAQAANDERIDLSWPSLLTRVERIEGFSFTSRSSYAALELESQLMHNCASSYVARCALADSHLLHIATDDQPVGTVEVRKEMYGDNPKILLVDAQTHDYAPLDPKARNALAKFQEACNDGRIRLNPDALEPRSVHANSLAPLLQRIPIAFSHWSRHNLDAHYFDLHAETSGAVVFDQYRDALEMERGSPRTLYQLAVLAVRRNQSMNSTVREYLENVVCAY